MLLGEALSPQVFVVHITMLSCPLLGWPTAGPQRCCILNQFLLKSLGHLLELEQRGPLVALMHHCHLTSPAPRLEVSVALRVLPVSPRHNQEKSACPKHHLSHSPSSPSPLYSHNSPLSTLILAMLFSIILSSLFCICIALGCPSHTPVLLDFGRREKTPSCLAPAYIHLE